MIDILIAVLQGIVEGITEWLPISSTGHLILLNEFLGSGGFFETDVFLYVIQLGAILAIVTLYFRRLNPFALSKTPEERSDTWQMWFKVAVASVPAAVLGLLLNDYMERFDNAYVISATLAVYGIGFIIVETLNKRRSPAVDKMSGMSYKMAVLIGFFQVLAIVPGTSRSGATILGAIIIGCSRTVAAEFAFFLAIPIMFGISGVKLLTYDGTITPHQWAILAVAMAVAYLVSLVAVKFLTGFVGKHDFKVFGWYRIGLAAVVIACALAGVI